MSRSTTASCSSSNNNGNSTAASKKWLRIGTLCVVLLSLLTTAVHQWRRYVHHQQAIFLLNKYEQQQSEPLYEDTREVHQALDTDALPLEGQRFRQRNLKKRQKFDEKEATGFASGSSADNNGEDYEDDYFHDNDPTEVGSGSSTDNYNDDYNVYDPNGSGYGYKYEGPHPTLPPAIVAQLPGGGTGPPKQNTAETTPEPTASIPQPVEPPTEAPVEPPPSPVPTVTTREPSPSPTDGQASLTSTNVPTLKPSLVDVFDVVDDTDTSARATGAPTISFSSTSSPSASATTLNSATETPTMTSSLTDVEGNADTSSTGAPTSASESTTSSRGTEPPTMTSSSLENDAEGNADTIISSTGAPTSTSDTFQGTDAPTTTETITASQGMNIQLLELFSCLSLDRLSLDVWFHGETDSVCLSNSDCASPYQCCRYHPEGFLKCDASNRFSSYPCLCHTDTADPSTLPTSKIELDLPVATVQPTTTQTNAPSSLSSMLAGTTNSPTTEERSFTPTDSNSSPDAINPDNETDTDNELDVVVVPPILINETAPPIVFESTPVMDTSRPIIEEPEPCLPFDQAMPLVAHPRTTAGCLTNSCGGGCCRIRNWLICDTTNTFKDSRCICNENTAPHAGFAPSSLLADSDTTEATDAVPAEVPEYNINEETAIDDSDLESPPSAHVPDSPTTLNSTTMASLTGTPASTTMAPLSPALSGFNFSQTSISASACENGSPLYANPEFAHFTKCVSSPECAAIDETHCCLERFCMCGTPHRNPLEECVPPFQVDFGSLSTASTPLMNHSLPSTSQPTENPTAADYGDGPKELHTSSPTVPEEIQQLTPLIETQACVPFDDNILVYANHPNTDEECRTNSGCSKGCCRSYWWLVCDENNDFTHAPCVCNENTRDPNTFPEISKTKEPRPSGPEDVCRDGSFYQDHPSFSAMTPCFAGDECGSGQCCLSKYCLCGVPSVAASECVPPVPDIFLSTSSPTSFPVAMPTSTFTTQTSTTPSVHEFPGTSEPGPSELEDVCREGSLYQNRQDFLAMTPCFAGDECDSGECCLSKYCLCGVPSVAANECVPPVPDNFLSTSLPTTPFSASLTYNPTTQPSTTASGTENAGYIEDKKPSQPAQVPIFPVPAPLHATTAPQLSAPTSPITVTITTLGPQEPADTSESVTMAPQKVSPTMPITVTMTTLGPQETAADISESVTMAPQKESPTMPITVTMTTLGPEGPADIPGSVTVAPQKESPTMPITVTMTTLGPQETAADSSESVTMAPQIESPTMPISVTMTTLGPQETAADISESITMAPQKESPTMPITVTMTTLGPEGPADIPGSVTMTPQIESPTMPISVTMTTLGPQETAADSSESVTMAPQKVSPTMPITVTMTTLGPQEIAADSSESVTMAPQIVSPTMPITVTLTTLGPEGPADIPESVTMAPQKESPTMPITVTMTTLGPQETAADISESITMAPQKESPTMPITVTMTTFGPEGPTDISESVPVAPQKETPTMPIMLTTTSLGPEADGKATTATATTPSTDVCVEGHPVFHHHRSYAQFEKCVTSDDCGSTIGECCLANFCLCGPPRESTSLECVPSLLDLNQEDLENLLATQATSHPSSSETNVPTERPTVPLRASPSRSPTKLPTESPMIPLEESVGCIPFESSAVDHPNTDSKS